MSYPTDVPEAFFDDMVVNLNAQVALLEPVAKHFRTGQPLDSEEIGDEAEAVSQLREAVEYLKLARTLIKQASSTIATLPRKDT